MDLGHEVPRQVLKTVSDVRSAAEKFLPRGSNRFYQNGLTYLGAVDGLPLGRKAPMPEKLVSALSNFEDVLVVGVVESWPTTADLLQAKCSIPRTKRRTCGTATAIVRGRKHGLKSLSSVDIVRDLRGDGYWGDIRRFLLFENAFYAAGAWRGTRWPANMYAARCPLGMETCPLAGARRCAPGRARRAARHLPLLAALLATGRRHRCRVAGE